MSDFLSILNIYEIVFLGLAAIAMMVVLGLLIYVIVGLIRGWDDDDDDDDIAMDSLDTITRIMRDIQNNNIFINLP